MKKWLGIIVAAGALIRFVLPAHAVFKNGVVNFLGPDSYWRMNNAKNITESGDYGLNYDTLLAILGDISIIVPVLFGAAVIVAVYLITRRLFDEKAGLFAAGFLALWPGEFMARTFLGAVDHHALESFITTLIALVFIYIITQPKLISWKTTAGIGIIVLAFMAYRYIWPHLLLPVIDQPLQIQLTNTETMPLAQSPNYIPQLDFVLAGLTGFIVVKFAQGWHKWVLIFWTVVMLFLTIYQVRFDYYLIIPVSVMVGFWLSWLKEKTPVKKVKR